MKPQIVERVIQVIIQNLLEKGKFRKFIKSKTRRRKVSFLRYMEIHIFNKLEKVIIAGLNILSGKLSKAHRFRVLRNG